MPTRSWWIGHADRASFNAAMAEESDRMARSRFGTVAWQTLGQEHQRKLDKKQKEQETL